MLKKMLMFTVVGVVLSSMAFVNFSSGPKNQKSSDRQTKLYNKVDGDPSSIGNPPNPEYGYTPLVLEGAKNNGDYVIGPEILTNLSGYYNYQFNGSNGHYIYRDATNNLVHAIYMYASDSLNISPTRRTAYATSTNDGATWVAGSDCPLGIRSGFCSLTLNSDGTASVGNHMVGSLVGGNLAGFNHYDLSPGVGVWTDVEVPPNYIWPLVNRLGNNNILVAGTCYQGSAATDTFAFSIFNATTHTFGAINRWDYLNNHASEANEAMGQAANTNGGVTMLLDPYRETGGNWGGPRIYVATSSNNGTSWNGPSVIFDPHVIGTDSIFSNVNGACDVVMDNAGNYYWAFNSLGPSGAYANARLLVGKNNTEPKIVAGSGNSPVNPISHSVISMPPEAFIASFDHPCLSISDDGLYVFVSYSVTWDVDTNANGFHKAHIFYSWASTSTMVWSTPVQVTSDGPNSFDEKYSSINRITPHVGSAYNLYMTYQKCPQAGNYSTATPDQTVIRRAYLMFRKITDATSPIGIKNENELVKEYSLSQNFPNPFNPSTLIKFSLPKGENVTLKIYDLDGKLVTTLLSNKAFNSGNHEVEFNASNFASGVYFYSISAGNFSDTKKMILVK